MTPDQKQSLHPDEQEKEVILCFGHLRDIVCQPGEVSFESLDEFFQSHRFSSQPDRIRYALVAYTSFWALLDQNDRLLEYLAQLKDQGQSIGQQMLCLPSMPFQLAHWMLRLLSQQEDWPSRHTPKSLPKDHIHVSTGSSYRALKNIPKSIHHNAPLKDLCASLLNMVAGIRSQDALMYLEKLEEKNITSNLRVGGHLLMLHITTPTPKIHAQQWVKTATDEEVIGCLQVFSSWTTHSKNTSTFSSTIGQTQFQLALEHVLLPSLDLRPAAPPLSPFWQQALSMESHIQDLFPFSPELKAWWEKARLCDHVSVSAPATPFKRKI